MINRVRDHLRKHREAYIAGGLFVIAGITCLIVNRNRYETLANGGVYGPSAADTVVTMRPFSFLSKQSNVVNVTHRDGRGHPGYLVKNIDTNEYFLSQKEAATRYDISENILSKHLNGIFKDAQGNHFERVHLV